MPKSKEKTRKANATNNNNNGYRNCCCMRSASVQEDDLEDDFVLVFQEAYTKIAYVYTVSRCLAPGTYLHVHGRTNPGCTRFSVDFTCGPRSVVDGTIAFHFNPRIQEGYVVRNCLMRGFWGIEETTSTAKLTLKPDTDFELVFHVTPSEFHARVNGQHFCSFRHRVQWERITSVEFVGDIGIRDCIPKDSYNYSLISNPNDAYKIPIDIMYDVRNTSELPMPFLGKITEKLKPGDHIEICGKVKLLPHSFYINLQHGFDIYPHSIIPLHLNPRFSASCGANAFVRNAWVRGKWLQEERAPGFPFSPGYSFMLSIQMDEKCYGIWVNDKLIAEYPYKVENQFPVDAIYIQGDIFLRHVSIQTKSRMALYGFSDETVIPEL